MRKIRLNVETLRVVSFAVGVERERVGTVQGHDSAYTGCACPAPPPDSKISDCGTCPLCCTLIGGPGQCC